MSYLQVVLNFIRKIVVKNGKKGRLGAVVFDCKRNGCGFDPHQGNTLF